MTANFSLFNEQTFKQHVNEALKSVERILNVHRNPRLAEDVDHEYENKYDLANLMANTWIIAQMNCLERMGLIADVLKTIDKSQSTTLRFQASNQCTFLREITLQVPMENSYEISETTQTNSPSFQGTTTKSTIGRVINNIKEYHWKVEAQWELSVYSGTNADNRTVLQARSGSTVVVVQSNQVPPLPEQQIHEPHDVSLTWLMNHIDNEVLAAQFKIDTQHADTKTPSRNPQVAEALEFLTKLSNWSRHVGQYFSGFLQNIIDKHNPAGPQTPKSKQTAQLGRLSSKEIFNPIEPLMEEPVAKVDSNEMAVDHKSVLSWAKGEEEDIGELDEPSWKKPSPLLSTNDMNKFLNEQIRSLEEKGESIRKLFPAKEEMMKLITVAEATMFLLCNHCKDLNGRYIRSVMYVEKMLENQLNAAIGKRVNSEDVDKFVSFHNAKLLNPPPLPFCMAIRRPDHYPDGILSIEAAGEKKEPIETFVSEVKMNSALKMPLSAAATLQLTGQTFLHGWLRHRFQNDSHKSYQMIARARQFSSFMLVVGTMVGADRLQPQDAIIVQNKDEVIIPLLLDEIPSAKEFKDAIKSLSPEQQRFAKAFRGMQLESSVLGVCVIQIKPQLEKLLGLPNDSLTKEMKLTQYLMKMFVEYQIPSDLLSYDGVDADASVREKVNNVKAHVQAVADVIECAKMNDWEAGAYRATAAAHQAAQTAFGSGAAVSASASFGAAIAPAAGGLFGAPAAAPGAFAAQGPSPFGSPAPAPAPSAFGAPPTPTNVAASPGTPSLFGTAATPQGAITGTGFSFGAPPPAQAAALSVSAAASPPAPTGRSDAVSPAERTPRAQTQMVARRLATEGNERQMTEREKGSAPETTPASEERKMPPTGEAQSESEPKPGNDDDETGEQGNDISDLLLASKHDGAIDFTSLPKVLDAVIEKHNTDGALCSTVIKTASTWERSRQENLLLPTKQQQLGPQDIKSEKNKAFDLLDALSRSGALPIACSELHVIVCLTHCFEKDVVGTVIQDNVNPIEKLEVSTLMLASAVHGVTPKELVRDSTEIIRMSACFPELL